MPKTGKTNSSSKSAATGPPCAYCTNSTSAEEAVKCSACRETAHRYCAGVPMKEFESISESSPYECAKCQRESYLSTICEMKCTITALQAEVCELRSAMNELYKTHVQDLNTQDAPSGDNPALPASRSTNHQWSDVVRRRRRARKPGPQQHPRSC